MPNTSSLKIFCFDAFLKIATRSSLLSSFRCSRMPCSHKLILPLYLKNSCPTLPCPPHTAKGTQHGLIRHRATGCQSPWKSSPFQSRTDVEIITLGKEMQGEWKYTRARQVPVVGPEAQSGNSRGISHSLLRALIMSAYEAKGQVHFSRSQ